MQRYATVTYFVGFCFPIIRRPGQKSSQPTLFNSWKTFTLFDHLLRRFPEHVTAIQALANVDATMRSILADYEEISTWLAVHDGSATPGDAELEHARKVIRDLENEISGRLEEHNDSNS